MALDQAVAQRARKRIAWRILPFLFLLYIIAFLDRINVGAAALQMPADLGFDDRAVGLGAGMFFIGYLVLEIPGALIAERWSARRWIARIMISWGILTVLMAFIRTSRDFYVVRFLVGAAEAGFFPQLSFISPTGLEPRIARSRWRGFTPRAPFRMSSGLPSPVCCWGFRGGVCEGGDGYLYWKEFPRSYLALSRFFT